MVWDLWCFEDLEEKDETINQLNYDGGVCRTAPATPGLLNILKKKKILFKIISQTLKETVY